MKNILITGENSYIGVSVKRWLMKTPDKYQVKSTSVRGNEWKKIDFSLYDVVLHVAGIAHTKETSQNKYLYYKVNRDLAYEVAQKAKKNGVKQFIFLSSMSVYGLNNGRIEINTPLQPTSAYGKSKVEAELLINSLANEQFIVTILRPPMVYGKGCKGNYKKLATFALKMPIFPKINNERSMIYIDNLSEIVKQIIDNRRIGIFFPQNNEYVNTSSMVKEIAEAHGKKMKLTKWFNSLLSLFGTNIVNKVFGDLVYAKNMSEDISEYCIIDFKTSIIKTELGN